MHALSERTRIQLCGRLSIEIDGSQRAGALRGRQVPVLLAYLVLHRSRTLTREELIGALWPARSPASQDAALRTLLSRVRAALPGATLSGREELQLELPAPVWVDLEAAEAELERARTALERGDARAAWASAQIPLNIASRGLLPGVHAEWLEPRRRDLADLRLQAMELIGQAGLRLGRAQLPSVERTARALRAAEPYRESGYVLSMKALAAGGNVAEALRVFEELRQLLRDELGTAPSPEAIAVHERLLSPVAAPPALPAGADATRVELQPELQVVPGELVGREQDLQRVWALLGLAPEDDRARRASTNSRGSAHEAQPRLVLIQGEAGIGKTHLVANLARRAFEAGAAVLAGRSSQDAMLPYQPFVEALGHYVLSIPAEELGARAGELGGELALLLPELRRRLPDLPQPLAGDGDSERYRMFEAVVELLAEVSAETTLLLILGDLHWADRTTLLLLRHVVRSPKLPRVVMIGTLRSAEAHGEALADALAEFRREGLAAEVQLAGLGERDTARLVELRAGVIPSAPLVRAIQDRTEGNPFFVAEIVRQLLDAGVDLGRAGSGELGRVGLPEGVKQVVARRLASMSPTEIEWLRAASVIGREFDLPLLEEVVALEEDDYLSALEAAMDAGLVLELPGAEGRYSFSHALIRQTLYEGMSLPRRTRIHRRVGHALEQLPGPPRLPALALHFTRAAGAAEAERAIAYARAAGEEASSLLAYEEAADHLSRALEVQERFRPEDLQLRLTLLLEVGEARVCAGERPLAWGTFREAASLAAAREDSASLARAALGASRRYIQPPGVVDEQLIGMLEQALEVTRAERTVTRVALLARLCSALYFSPQHGRMAELAREATAIAGELGDPEARALAAAARRRAFWDPMHLDQRIADATELLTLGRKAGDLELVLQGHAWLVLDLLEHGDAAAVDAQIEAFSTGAERLRQPLYLWHAMIWRGMRAMLTGRMDEAERLAGEALAIAVTGETVTAPQYYAIQLMAIRREQGRMAELESAARQMVQSNPTRPAWRAALGALLTETGRVREAREQVDALAEAGFGGIPQDGDWMTCMTLLADVVCDLGDHDRAATLYSLLEPYQGTNAVIGLGAVCLGAVARYLGRLAYTTGRREVAAAHFEAALEADEALGAPVCLAHTRLEYARLLGAGSAGGQALFDAAVRTGEELGLGKVLRRARELDW